MYFRSCVRNSSDRDAHSFINVDAAWLSGLKAYQTLLLLVAIYDIACQFMIHFLSRMTAAAPHLEGLTSLEPEDTTKVPRTIFGVPKWHEAAHEASCRYLFGLRYTEGTGQTDGEVQERNWARLIGLALSRREMLGGHRHDKMNDFHGHANEERTRVLRKSSVDDPRAFVALNDPRSV